MSAAKTHCHYLGVSQLLVITVTPTLKRPECSANDPEQLKMNARRSCAGARIWATCESTKSANGCGPFCPACHSAHALAPKLPDDSLHSFLRTPSHGVLFIEAMNPFTPSPKTPARCLF